MLTIIGTRPQIVKAAALHRALQGHTDIQAEMLYTGQHYDRNLSELLFDQLQLPHATYNLHVQATSHAEQTARMLAGIETILEQQLYDGIIIYGDTNSTLAGALAASQRNIPLFHIEAGLRSFNMTMPEEVNRIVSDHLSNVCYAPTENAYRQLSRESIDDQRTTFSHGRKRAIVLSGDVMYDNSLYYTSQQEMVQQRLHPYGLDGREYALATVHRAANTDDPHRLKSILDALVKIAQKEGIAMVLPLHPRTRKAMASIPITAAEGLMLLPPQGYLDMLALESQARVILTDSGGVQKEAYFMRRPCVILREETEWTEIVSAGAACLAGDHTDTIISTYESISKQPIESTQLFGDGHAAELILAHIIKYLS